MQWVRFRIKTITDMEDVIISTLYDIGLAGAQIEDKIPLTALEKEQMFVDLLPDGPEDDGVAYLNFFVEKQEDGSFVVHGIPRAGKVLDDFWNAALSEDKLSARFMRDSDATVETVDGKDIVVIRVPWVDR